jgi:hypothetical protein
VTCQRTGKFSAEVHQSEAVPLCKANLDSLSGRFIHADGLQLRERYGDISILSAGGHEHIRVEGLQACDKPDFYEKVTLVKSKSRFSLVGMD